jgi:hypothetical protein
MAHFFPFDIPMFIILSQWIIFFSNSFHKVIPSSYGTTTLFTFPSMGFPLELYFDGHFYVHEFNVLYINEVVNLESLKPFIYHFSVGLVLEYGNVMINNRSKWIPTPKYPWYIL